MQKIYNNLTELVGNTPLIYLHKYSREQGLAKPLIAKVEFFNPLSSVKDRVALKLITTALKQKLIDKDTTIIEPTSGNTGIGLAFVCAVFGNKIILTMPESMSIERRKMLSYLGAELILTPAAFGMQGAVDKAKELQQSIKNSFIPGQFDNEACVIAHRESTAEEIWRDTAGKVDAFVAGVGTGGTISGTGQRLKELNAAIEIVAVEPAASPLLSKGQAGPHKIQGIGANFVPKILDRAVIDKIITVENDDALQAARDICSMEGLPVGISSGAALVAATKFAKENPDKTIVVLLPDSAERYLSTELFN